MTRLAATAVRDAFGDTLNRVAYRGERIVLERHGKAVAALVCAVCAALAAPTTRATCSS